MYCKNCGAKNDENFSHCIECGMGFHQYNASDQPQRGSLGAYISLFSGLMAFFMFFMPWVAVCGITSSGFELAMESSELEDGISSLILFIIPFIALVIAMITFAKIRNRRSKPSKGALWRILLSLIGAFPLVATYQLKEDIREFFSWGSTGH